MESPLFNWLDHRAAGVLLHPTSLPNQYAIGNFGVSAKQFVDLAATSHFRYWQMLPLGPTGYGNSPYQAYSSHAINPLLMDLDDLLNRGWINESDLRPVRQSDTKPVDFDSLLPHHEKIRRKAGRAGVSDESVKALYYEFQSNHESWLNDYALFMALRKKNSGKPWYEWKKNHREHDLAVTVEKTSELTEEIEFIQFEQFILFSQWVELKAYANERNIKVVGDIPIYVSPDSVDVWANKFAFQVTKTGKFSQLAGVPPDYFNAEGQFWGNPLYNWKHLKETEYAWWIDRLGHTLSLFDVVRFDHFRALAGYWSIPAKATSAKEGKWVTGPGIDFFRAIKKELPEAKLILEDLGEITPDVIELRDRTGCPGLAVLQFAFGGNADNFYLPHNLSRNSVIYTGTHDNDTSNGWYHSATEQEQDHLRRYFRVSGEDACWDLIRSAYASVSNLCIIPVQDLLALGSEARMNTPGVAEGNWAWRLSPEQLFNLGRNSAAYLRELSSLYRRNP